MTFLIESFGSEGDKKKFHRKNQDTFWITIKWNHTNIHFSNYLKIWCDYFDGYTIL